MSVGSQKKYTDAEEHEKDEVKVLFEVVRA